MVQVLETLFLKEVFKLQKYFMSLLYTLIF